MNSIQKQMWDNALLLGTWVFCLASAVFSQVLNQMTNTQIVHLKVLS
jgi:hypothetical protein